MDLRQGTGGPFPVPEQCLSLEHVPSEMFANKHYADQLVERMGWALVDAEDQERAIGA